MAQDHLTDASPFHIGEQNVQARLGMRDIEDWARKIVRDHMPEQHRTFYTSLPFLVAAARDAAGRPWATLLSAPEGFITSPDPGHLRIDATPAPGDALEGALAEGADLGLLGIELATRRRNRVNGRVSASGAAGLTFAVDQSFGNCPQYIRERNWVWVEDDTPKTATRGAALTASQQGWIARADTFFIATGYRGEGESPTFGMDASHRGGERGFVEVLDDRRIRFPDYAGNKHFNTIGNLSLDPRAGYLFIDFSSGALLQITGTVEINWDSDDLARFPGARRLVTLSVEDVVESRNAVALRWDEEAETARELRVREKIVESADVTSLVFESRDGGPLPAFEAGQHLPIALKIPGVDTVVSRSYSLSGAPSADSYRITVKREPQGLASRFLHDQIDPGDIVISRNPGGDFTTPHGSAPVALISAGVGITPMVSMLSDLVAAGTDRRVVFAHGARDGAHHPLAAEVRDLAARAPAVQTHIAYSRPASEDRVGRDYDRAGRIDGAAVLELVGTKEADFMICGPVAFLAAIQEDLERLGVSPNRIHVESFGPAEG
ncbi:MAG: pyridoxamine 5'-phosphate oxidase family protein [Pseudomonadota bacterium]